MRILLVEDDKLLAAGIRESITSGGDTIDCLEDGESALDALSLERFDLVILDLGLPNLNGIDVLKGLAGKKCFPKSIWNRTFLKVNRRKGATIFAGMILVARA